MKEYHDMKPKEQKKEMASAKKIRLKIAKEKSPSKLHEQKIREKAYKHSKEDLTKAHHHMKEHMR